MLTWNLYGLLYVDHEHTRHANLRGRLSPLSVYIACARLLATSAARHGLSLRIVTNQPDIIREQLEVMGLPELATCTVRFDLAIPKGTPFYQAHFKLSVLEAFGRGELGSNVALIDLDAVILANLFEVSPQQSLWVYDITSTVPARYIRDLARLLGPHHHRPLRWFGGEFLAGPSFAFARLSEKVTELMPSYLAGIDSFSHVGDEMIVSAALNVLGAEGLDLVDLGAAGLVSRWWSSRVGFAQPPFASSERAAVLHLPADKPFLMEQALAPADLENFASNYRTYVRPKLRLRALTNPMLNLIHNEHKYAPRLY